MVALTGYGSIATVVEVVKLGVVVYPAAMKSVHRVWRARDGRTSTGF
jgi:ActR/RegA family two-component response regulator